ncbi:MAG TPA: L-aspartate oxidase [Phycisphaerae bacterium]|mgnify:FL=1|nr:L-aspartate oxidase [Phycisphaerae bacterium]
MVRHRNLRRYLVGFDTSTLPQIFTDCLVIGGGVAGLRVALEVAEAGPDVRVTLATKTELLESNSYYAQGGIAAVTDPVEDSPEKHRADTLATACGLADEAIVEMVVGEGPDRIRDLIDWGTPFDRDGDALSLTREGGHSARRILHASGDSTGREISQTMAAQARVQSRIVLRERTYTIDLLTGDTGEVLGALLWTAATGLTVCWARFTVLASGGAGRLYRESTNPETATGDGMAIAYRAGAELEDLEFVQFHPTTLYIAGASRALISETVRGEGGRLLDRNGTRFMPEYHADAELAPRDVVSRAIVRQMARTDSTNVYLDLRHLKAEHLYARFPFIRTICRDFDIDIARDLIPVRPAAHYTIGGVRVDGDGRTSLPRLYACGEVSCTRLHGANRLGSNSLLEGLVFGYRAGRRIVEQLAVGNGTSRPPRLQFTVAHSDRTVLDVDDVQNSLRAIMWRNVGIERDARHLAETEEIIEFWQSYVLDKEFADPRGWQLQNMLTLARLVARSANQRQESRGTHFRTDFPERDDAHWQHHIVRSVASASA